MQLPDDPPNAQVLLRYKSAKKTAMIVNMQYCNAGCASKARKFRLPSRDNLAYLLRQSSEDLWATKIDVKKC
jgi:hypothetical protein